MFHKLVGKIGVMTKKRTDWRGEVCKSIIDVIIKISKLQRDPKDKGKRLYPNRTLEIPYLPTHRVMYFLSFKEIRQ